MAPGSRGPRESGGVGIGGRACRRCGSVGLPGRRARRCPRTRSSSRRRPSWPAAACRTSGSPRCRRCPGSARSPTCWPARPTRSPTSPGSFFLVSALAMVVGSLLSARSQNRGAGAAAALGVPAPPRPQPRPGPADRAGPARRASEWGGPPPDTLWSVAASERLWERRPDDDDFGAVRIGVGRQQLAATAGSRRVRARSRTSIRCRPPRCGASSPPTARCPTCRCGCALRRFAAIGVTAPDDPERRPRARAGPALPGRGLPRAVGPDRHGLPPRTRTTRTGRG